MTNDTLFGILIGGSVLVLVTFFVLSDIQHIKEQRQECVQRLDTYQTILDEDKEFFCKHLI